MKTITPLLGAESRPRVAVFMSGTGSNAEKILEKWKSDGSDSSFEVATLVTDAPEKSRTRELAEKFEIPTVENDIRKFYHDRGESRISIATPEGQKIRREWTDLLRKKLRECEIDFCVFAGFVPLTNITSDYPCLNVHPGDLTFLKDGHRYLIGLHTVPVERAILEGLDHMRSSVILALPYTGKGDDMDNGPILGISPAVPIDLRETTLEEMKACRKNRPAKRPVGGHKDRLEEIARHNLTLLKENGDWTVFPPVVSDFAEGRFGTDAGGQLHYRIKSKWHSINTVVYDKNGKEILFSAQDSRP